MKTSNKCAHYSIVRYYAQSGKENRIMKTGLSRAEAVEHCEDPKTSKAGVWFDGFIQARACHCED